MKLFTEWLKEKNLTEGLAVGQGNSPQIGTNPTRSSMEKVIRAAQKGTEPFDLNPTVLRSTLGLSSEEMDSLRKRNLFNSNGFLDKQAFANFYKALTGSNPSIAPAGVKPAPPAPPMGGSGPVSQPAPPPVPPMKEQ